MPNRGHFQLPEAFTEWKSDHFGWDMAKNMKFWVWAPLSSKTDRAPLLGRWLTYWRIYDIAKVTGPSYGANILKTLTLDPVDLWTWLHDVGKALSLWWFNLCNSYPCMAALSTWWFFLHGSSNCRSANWNFVIWIKWHLNTMERLNSLKTKKALLLGPVC